MASFQPLPRTYETMRYPVSLVFFVLLSSATVSADSKPNIIYLMTDDQRADALGCMGNKIIQTPNIDEMANEAVVFDNAFVTTAICMTSRACVLTGQYAARHGVWSFRDNLAKEQLSATYIGKLKAAGYRTGFIGKWGVGNPKSAESILDFNKGFPGQSKYYEDLKKKDGRHLTARMGDQAIEFLEGCDKEEPFLLSVSFKSPHCQDSGEIYSDQFPPDHAYESLYSELTIPRPFTSAERYYLALPDFLKDSMNRDRWAVRFRSPSRYQQCVKDYYRLITGVDAVVGRIREKLSQLGHDKDTIIIFTSDHGFFLGEYGFAGKWTPHEVSIRVPLVIYDPTSDKGHGTRRSQMTLGIDMAPTICDFAGVEAPREMQGSSLKPLVHGESPDDWREAFFYEHWFNAGGRIAPSEGVRDRRWKYARYLKLDRIEEGEARYEELYDLDTDPHETVNLVEDSRYAGVLERQRMAWKQWRDRVK